jgi:hypothetical protein
MRPLGRRDFLCDLCESLAFFAVKLFNRKVREDCAKFAKNEFSYQVKGCGSLNLQRCLARQRDEAHWKLAHDNAIGRKP